MTEEKAKQTLMYIDCFLRLLAFVRRLSNMALALSAGVNIL